MTKNEMMNLYDEKLSSLNLQYVSKHIDTIKGRTHVIITGNIQHPPLVLLHGIHAGAPMALEALKDIVDDYCVYAIDTVGQCTKSETVRMDISNDDFAVWLADVLDHLGLQHVNFVAVSYGAYILQRLLKYKPQYVKNAVFVVPSGFANAQLSASIKYQLWPLIKFNITKSEKHLKSFLSSFADENDRHLLAFQRLLLTGVKMDYRLPPLVNKVDMLQFEGKVFLVVAGNDMFFPAKATITKALEVFKNIGEIWLMENAKHIPESSHFPAISSKIKTWLTQ